MHYPLIRVRKYAKPSSLQTRLQLFSVDLWVKVEYFTTIDIPSRLIRLWFMLTAIFGAILFHHKEINIPLLKLKTL